MRFSWDEEKDRENQAKHGLPFSAAEHMFGGPTLEQPDYSTDEPRTRALGIIEGRVCFCVFTDRGDERRIISLRQATRNEHDSFFKEIFQGDRLGRG